MHYLIAHVLGLQPDHLAAPTTGAGKVCFIAGNAGGMLISQDIPLAGQLGVTMPAAEVVSMPVPVQRPGVCPREYKLITGTTTRLDLLCIMPLTK